MADHGPVWKIRKLGIWWWAIPAARSSVPWFPFPSQARAIEHATSYLPGQRLSADYERQLRAERRAHLDWPLIHAASPCSIHPFLPEDLGRAS